MSLVAIFDKGGHTSEDDPNLGDIKVEGTELYGQRSCHRANEIGNGFRETNKRVVHIIDAGNIDSSGIDSSIG